MSRSCATHNARPLMTAAAGSVATAIVCLMSATSAFASSEATPLKKKVVDTTTSIYRCTLPDGTVAYSDIRCKGASKIERWQAEKVAPGITPSRAGNLNDILDGNTGAANTQRDDPYVACKKVGGTWYAAAKLCKLAPEARIRISFD